MYLGTVMSFPVLFYFFFIQEGWWIREKLEGEMGGREYDKNTRHEIPKDLIKYCIKNQGTIKKPTWQTPNIILGKLCLPHYDVSAATGPFHVTRWNCSAIAPSAWLPFSSKRWSKSPCAVTTTTVTGEGSATEKRVSNSVFPALYPFIPQRAAGEHRAGFWGPILGADRWGPIVFGEHREVELKFQQLPSS